MALRRRVEVLIFASLMVAATAASAAGGDLHLRRISPSGDDVPTGQEIVFQFDRAMVALGNMARSPADIPITIEPAVGCEWRWLDTSELVCRLPGKATLRPATRYTITVGSDFRALDGARLAHAVTSGFTTILPQVDWLSFQQWRSPVMPVYLLRFNLPVTAEAVAAHVGFNGNDGHNVAALADPFTKKREGPVWLSVEGMPGLLLEIENPQPATPLDARNAAGEARLQWLVRPAKPLEAASEYDLALAPGLTTPLGELSAKGGLPTRAHLETWGPFRFRGVACEDVHANSVDVAPGESQRVPCEPTSLRLAFSAPVPLSTLAVAEWKPAPRPLPEMKRKWLGYPVWYLGIPQDPTGAARNQSFPLPFDMKATSAYRITIPAGVHDAFGRTLAEATTVTVRTGHFAPFFDGPPDEAVLEAKVPTIVPLRFVNLKRLEFRYRRLLAQDLGHPVAPLRRPPAAATSILARSGLRVREDRIVTVPLGLRKLLGGHAGAAWGEISWAPGPGTTRSASQNFFGEVTPWQVFAKIGYFDSLVWVSSLATGAAIPQAKVAFYVGHPESLDRLERLGGKPDKTDLGGLAVLPGTLGFGADWFQPWENGALHYYVGVTENGRLALLPLDWSFRRYIGDASDYNLYENNAPAWGHLEAWAMTQQGIYRPASDVHFALFVRNVSNASLVAPPALDYGLKIEDPTGTAVLEQKHLKLGPFGGFATTLHLPKTAPMGWYAIQLSWPTSTGKESREIGRFLVTEFVPASFKVSAMLAGSQFAPGESVRASARARLHAGGPYSDADIKFSAEIDAEAFQPDTPEAAGFSFAANPASAPSSLAVGSIETRLDHQGEAATLFRLPENPPIYYGRLALEAAVKSERGSWVANRTSAQFAARDRFVGLHLEDWLLTAQSPATVQYLVVNAKGKPAAGAPVHLLLQRQVVTSARVKNAAGYFTANQQTMWKDEDSCRAVSAAKPGSCTLTPRHAGSYRIVAEVRDSEGREQTSTLQTWATGPGAVVWPQNKRVGLVPDKSEYHPGDTAHVLVQNPFPGAVALVTVERYGVLWKKTMPLAGSTPLLDIPIEPGFFPGAYLSVAVFSPRVDHPGSPDLGRPELALGYVALPVSGNGSSLAVKVTPAERVYKPGETVAVKVHVAREDGKTSAGTRLVAVVLDQGVLDLLEQGKDYYDPRKRFYAPPEGPDMLNFSLAEQLLTELQPKTGKGKSPGGGGGAGPDIRTIFKYSAYWNPTLATDAAGNANFSFTLPDNLTRWRIFVIAMTPAAAMGLGDASVRVNLPIQIQPALP
ncbi:MAG TPA: MG2 domain-containing protein, partial [Gammaproteobacteria bacterium]|nr:MG2 domain-containing protein [Gammaproteobacteria bacterium]